ncbi:glycosyltransferase family 2 protein [Flavobacterium hiemivividum]|uniref:Glycosyltransferase family 2 protein n=1 Tax=Flavobacterium hiemivividum TaxID=2541734 RepID=A0A4R5CV40_9FLAO|nr:glycosyltransferase family 2 protein [Flavobacterium hiemivividum]TDE04582.1 glycosyltransferase family 2 protein [Flavobacterium hiemivividum]
MSVKVSIIMATYNRAHFIVETLKSIQSQTFLDWECLIVDDGGTDNTIEVITPFLLKDDRFKYYKRPNGYQKGLSGCRNYGLDIANGQFIQFFDDDDLMHPKKIELQLSPFYSNKNIYFTVCKYEFLIEKEDGSVEIIRQKFDFSYKHVGDSILLGDIKINSLSTLWKKNILLEFRFDESLKYAEEWELYTRITYKYPNDFGIVDEYLFIYRKHSNSLTLGKDLDFEKRKTAAIIRVKLSDYLTENKLHTKKSILFFAKTFFIYYYNPNEVKKLIGYTNEAKGYSMKLILFLRIGLLISKFHSKTITKLASLI